MRSDIFRSDPVEGNFWKRKETKHTSGGGPVERCVDVYNKGWMWVDVVSESAVFF